MYLALILHSLYGANSTRGSLSIVMYVPVDYDTSTQTIHLAAG